MGLSQLTIEERELGDVLLSCNYQFGGAFEHGVVVYLLVNLVGVVFKSSDNHYTVHVSAIKVLPSTSTELLEAYEDIYDNVNTAIGIYEAKVLEFRNRYKR